VRAELTSHRQGLGEAQSGAKRLVLDGGKWQKSGGKFTFNKMQPKLRKLGRPTAERLSPEDAFFIKAQIRDTYGSLAKFYEEAFTEARAPKFRGRKQPSELATVDRAFDNAFSGRRALPEIYWMVLEELLNVTRDKLPSSARSPAPTTDRESAATQNTDPPGLPTTPNNLPRQDRSVIGRENEISALLYALSKSNRYWLVSITGVGGVGKSALALEVARRCLELRGLPEILNLDELKFDAFVWTSAKKRELDGPSVRLRLSVKSNLSSILQEVLRVLAPENAGAMPSEERQRDKVMELLRRKRTLLIVDNMETIEDEQVLAFLQEVPFPSKAIITDRRAVHESRSFPLTELSEEEAMQMIRDQCASELNAHRLQLSDAQIEAIARKTGGIPLAIIWVLGRIVATRCDPESVIRRLADAGSCPLLDFLFEDSFRLVREDARRLMAALALPGTLVRGDMLGDWLNIGRNDLEDALDELRQFALIVDESNQSVPLPTIQRSYRLLPLARDFVMSRAATLIDRLDRSRIHERLLCFASVEDGNPDWPSIEKIDLIDEHHELLAWGVEDAFNSGHHEIVLQLVRALGYALGIRGYNTLRLRLAELAEHAAKAMNNPLDLARVLITNKAWVYFFWADYAKCSTALEEGFAASRRAKDTLLEAVSLRLKAQLAKEQKNLADAESLLTEALRRFNDIGDAYQLAITLGTWGSLSRDLRNYQEAESSLREALRVLSPLPNAEELRSIMCQKLAKLMIELNRLPEAEEYNIQAEAILARLRRQVGVAYCKLNLARIAERRSDFKRALDYAKEAEVLFVQYGDKREIAADLQRIQERAGKPVKD